MKKRKIREYINEQGFLVTNRWSKDARKNEWIIPPTTLKKKLSILIKPYQPDPEEIFLRAKTMAHHTIKLIGLKRLCKNTDITAENIVWLVRSGYGHLDINRYGKPSMFIAIKRFNFNRGGGNEMFRQKNNYL